MGLMDGTDVDFMEQCAKEQKRPFRGDGSKLCSADDFTKGYICACANLMSQHGEDVYVRDLVRDLLGCNMPPDNWAGIDEMNREVLEPIVREIKRRQN
jgi:hypothetical protein